MNIENNDMTDSTSPRPWSVRKATPSELRFAVIDNPNGISVATVWNKADAALIVEAVNERDALRDLVRRLADGWESSIRECDPRANEVLADPHNLANALIRKARKTLGENKQ